MKMKLILSALFALFIVGCNKRTPMPTEMLFRESLVQPRKEVNLVVMPQVGRMPAHILCTQIDTYQFNSTGRNSFKKELVINPLMHEVTLKAQVMRGNKMVREYEATKSIQTILNDSKTTWTNGRAKLNLTIASLAPQEYVVVTTNYAWMDPRWHWPFFLESEEPTGVSQISIDVPFGVVMRFKASKNGEPFELVPESSTVEHLSWGQKSKQSGLGSRYVFAHDFALKPSAPHPSARMQLFFSFDLAMQQEKSSLFHNWEAVSSFLYDRIDRYDLPSNTIRDFTQNLTESKDTDLGKVTHVLGYLKKDIEKRMVLGSFLEQDVQPATRTFARRFGSPFDIAILAKAMLSSIGIKSDLMAIATPQENTRMSDFFTPSIFSKVILAINADDQTFYVDPSANTERLDTMPLELQGQNALLIRKEKGQFFALPFAGPEQNETSLAYEMLLSPEGKLEGSFSLDLNGLRAEELRISLKEMDRSLSAPELQNHLNLGDTLRWQTAALRDQKDSNIINISGYLSPRFLKKEETGHSLSIIDILKPALAPVMGPLTQNYSHMMRLYAAINLPENYRATELSHDGFIEGEGISGRFLVQQKENVLFFDGESIIALPLGKNHQQILAPQQKALQSLGETKLTIAVNKSPGGNDLEKPVSAENF